MKEALLVVVVSIGIIAGILLVILVPAYLLGTAECNRIESNGTPTEYRIIGGCYVEVNGRYIPKENWRGEYEL